MNATPLVARNELTLSWHGPYVFVPQAGFDCVFDRPEAGNPGLYLWTIEYQNGYLVNYVGETKDFKTRLRRHVEGVLGGRERWVCDPEQFRQGRIVILATVGFSEFLADYPRLSNAIYELYRTYRVFIAPTSVEESIRKYVENGIIRTLKGAVGTVAAFLCNVRDTGRSPKPLTARFGSGPRFHGLPEVIEC